MTPEVLISIFTAMLALLAVIGGAWVFIFKRLDAYVPRKEFERHVLIEYVPRKEFEMALRALYDRFGDLAKRFDGLHETVHEVRNMVQNILIEERRRTQNPG